MAHLQAVLEAPKIDPRALDIQARIEFLKSTTRLVGHFRFVPEDDPDKDIHRFCQGLSDRFDGLAQRIVAPGATEDPEVCDIFGELQGIRMVLDTISYFPPEMKEGRYLDQISGPVSGMFCDFFVFLSSEIIVVEEALDAIIDQITMRGTPKES